MVPGGFAFNQLSSVNIGNGVISIGEGAFTDNKLTAVIIPDSVSSIEKWAFFGNKLESINIGANVDVKKDSFTGNFANFYAQSGKAAGTYT
jgi:hypothetical protein